MKKYKVLKDLPPGYAYELQRMVKAGWVEEIDKKKKNEPKKQREIEKLSQMWFVDAEGGKHFVNETTPQIVDKINELVDAINKLNDN